MNSGNLKTYKYVKISKSNFFVITILSLQSICSESNKNKKIQTADYEQINKESFAKNKTGKYLNANQKYLAEFYIGFNISNVFSSSL